CQSVSSPPNATTLIGIGLTLEGQAVDLGQLVRRELEPVQGAEILVQLLHAADPDDRSRHPRVAERPRERHLRERLAALARDVAQRPDRLEVLVDLVREERIALRRPRALRDAA